MFTHCISPEETHATLVFKRQGGEEVEGGEW